MTTPEEVLAKVPLFSMLSKKELTQLAKNAHDRTFPAGAVLTEQDATGVTFGVIAEGQAAVSVGGQAADGMQLSRSNGSSAATADGLENAEALHKRTITNLLSFKELREAPVVDAEDYHGPVLDRKSVV